MKFKQLCIMATISMITLTGCQDNKSKDYEKEVSELKARIESLQEIITNLKSSEQEVSNSTEEDDLTDDGELEEENSIIDRHENPNYTTNIYYFEEDEYIIKGEQKYTLEELMKMNNEQVNKEVFNIYDHEYEDEDSKYKLIKSEKTVELGRDLDLEVKLNLLCDALEKEMGDIEIMVSSVKDDKVATVIAVEKYPAWGSITPILRSERIEETLSQPEYKGKWFDYITVVYDSGTFGDI